MNDLLVIVVIPLSGPLVCLLTNHQTRFGMRNYFFDKFKVPVLCINCYCFLSWLSFFFSHLMRQRDKVAVRETLTPFLGESPSSRDPQGEKAEVKSAKRNNKKLHKKSFNKRMDKKVEEFEERMEANAKKYKKMEKKMEKPQYSDPSYFGHKKKPKRDHLGSKSSVKSAE